MSVHTCHAEGCDTRCKPEFLMCPRHWRMVPPPMQRAIYAAYQPGQCNLDPLPSDEWFAAAFAAIDHVAVLDKGEPRKMMVGHYPKRAGVDTVALADLDKGEPDG